MKKMLLVALLLPSAAYAQDAVEAQRLFEAGQYQQAIDAVGDAGSPAAIYIAAQGHQKLGAATEARQTYGRLAARADADAWHFVGLSAQQLLDNQTDPALASARQAAALAGGLPEAHYQMGLVLAKRQDWRGAAEAFDHAAELNPRLAYAQYYGGLMYYRAKRPDQMGIRFERFLKLAPNAPERPEVLQVMRTARGQ